MNFRKYARRSAAGIGVLAVALQAAGCGRTEPARVYTVPAGASAAETSPGQPTPPPDYRPSSGLPGPPPGPPPVQ